MACMQIRQLTLTRCGSASINKSAPVAHAVHKVLGMVASARSPAVKEDMTPLCQHDELLPTRTNLAQALQARPKMAELLPH